MNIEIALSDRPPLRSGFPAVLIHVPDLDIHHVLDIDARTLHRSFGEPDPIALDFLLIASIVYIVDKGVRRYYTDDFWTREFSLSIPVSDPNVWSRVRPELAECLAFLTGDIWHIGFAARTDGIFSALAPARRPDKPPDVRVVSLFSGGMDSLIGVLDWLAAREGNSLLMGHHDATGPAGDQRRLYSTLNALPPYADRCDWKSVRIRPLPLGLAREGQRVHARGSEPTLRSRSLVFLALGLYAARAVGTDVHLLVPENGFIAINIPLTASRIGTCSTRTTHPFFLDSVRRVAATVGLPALIDNPLALLTKGEAIANCRDQASLARLVAESVSCAHASRRGRWVRRYARNCGYCVPCLIRRAALHHVGWDDGAAYGIDVCTSELDLDEEIAGDARAVLDCLDQVRTDDDIADRVAMTGPLPPEQDDAYIAMVGRGIEEVRTFVRDKGSDAMKQRAGVR